jgi:hypothetical protein
MPIISPEQLSAQLLAIEQITKVATQSKKAALEYLNRAKLLNEDPSPKKHKKNCKTHAQSTAHQRTGVS